MAPQQPHLDPPGEQRHRSRPVDRLFSAALILLVRSYQLLVRPWLAGSCKFAPTCSEYAVEALHRHGPWRGTYLTARRVARCHPFGPGGFDPVP